MAMEAIMASMCCQSSKTAQALQPQARKANASKQWAKTPLEQRFAEVHSRHKKELDLTIRREQKTSDLQLATPSTKEPSNRSMATEDADWYSCTSRMLTDEGVPDAAEVPPIAPIPSRTTCPHFTPLLVPASKRVKSPDVSSPVVAPPAPVALPNLLARRGMSAEAAEKKHKLANGPSVPTSKVDFSGKWCMTHAEGDFNQLLVDAGVSWALRRMAKSMNYGLGVTFQNITQNGDSFVLEHVTPLKSTTMEFEAGSGYQETVGADGSRILVKAQLDGVYLTISSKQVEGRSYVPARRYLQPDGQMVIETALSTGGTLKRFFKRSDTR